MKYLALIVLGGFLAACANHKPNAKNFEYERPENVNSLGKITGVNLEMPNKIVDQAKLDSIGTMNAEWVALIPYGFTAKGEARVQFGSKWQWWGETKEGTETISKYAKAAGQKVMFKPHVWVVGDGWPGDFDLETEEEWLEWETTYRDFILTFAAIADSVDADMFCIGTEYRKAAVKRAPFWRKLIKEVREVYGGKVTYAANWDNYENIVFWDDLDYIGIDAYFPLSNKQTPSYEEMVASWNAISRKLKPFSEKYDKPVLFTEYGFKSADFSVSDKVLHDSDLKVNQESQYNAYRAFFASIWNEPFMAGGFLWKWSFFQDQSNSGWTNPKFTPQGKPAFKIVKEVYGAK